MTFADTALRFRSGTVGLGGWLVIQTGASAADCITWGWMLGFLEQPHLFARYPMLLAFLHLAVAAIVAGSYYGFISAPHEKRFWAGIAGILGVLMPVTGIIMTGVAFVVAESPEKSRFLDEIDELTTWTRLERRHAADLDAPFPALAIETDEHYDVTLLRSLDVEPLYDILTSRNSIYRRNALGKITQNPDRRSVDLLRKCLDDDNPDIRFYASSALGRIEENLNAKQTRLKEELLDRPDDRDLKLRLADHYLTIAELRIAPPATEVFYLENALTLLGDMDAGPDIVEQRIRLLNRLQRYPEALELLATLKQPGVLMQRIKCDILLRLKRFGELRNACRDSLQIPDVVNGDSGFREALTFWTDDHDPESKPTADCF